MLDKSPELKSEIRLPLEILANVIYLTKHYSSDSEKVTIYMDAAEKTFADLLAALRNNPESINNSDQS